MVEDKNPSQDTVEISRHVALPKFSYDKDVVEIKLPDIVGSGGNFVKDVCIDEGTLLHRNTSDEKPVDKRTSPNISCQMIGANCDMRYGNKVNARKSVQELKPEAVVPVDFAPPDWNGKQYSSDKEYDLEGRITTGDFASDPSDKKISLQELLRLESAEEAQHAGKINSDGSERHKRPLHEEAIGQATIDDLHGVQSNGSKTSEHANCSVSSCNISGYAATMPEDHDEAAGLDARETNKINRYNPFIDHRSLEDTSEHDCSIPGITDAASLDPICAVDNTDSFSNVVSDSRVLNEVKAAATGVDALSSCSSDIQSSEKSDDHSGSISSKAITGETDETAFATSSSRNDAEPSVTNGEYKEKCTSDGVADVNDSDQIDEEHCMDTDDAVSKSYTLVPAVERTAPGSSKSAARISNGDPFEPNLFGPSIMSGPVSISGHIAYSGNVSLRSDSSTTSTRSFAFPVLQREWISSPVRMAKAERARTRRRYGWRKGLICCKF